MLPRRLAPLLVVQALLLAGLVGWVLVRSGAVAPSPVAASGPTRADAELAAPSAGSGGVEETTTLPEAGAPERATVAEPAADDLPRDDRLTGEVLDYLGQPLPGAQVSVRHRPFGEDNSLDLEANRLTRPVGATATDDEGRFAVEVPPHRPLEVTVEAPRHARAVMAQVFGGEHLRVALGLGALLEGRVVDASTGLGVADVALRGWMRQPTYVRDLLTGTTDATGGFRFDGLPAGQLTLELEPRVLAAPAWQDLTLEPGGRVWREFALERGVTISGRVTDASTGEPIADAEVGAGWVFDRPVRTDAEGRYALRGFGGPGVYDVHARAAGHGKAQHEYPFDGMPTEDAELDFELPPARAAFGVVVDADGAPLEGVYVAAVASERIDGLQHTDWDATRTDAEGRFRVGNLTPNLPHRLVVRHEGHGREVYAFPPDEAEHAELDLGTIALHPGGRLVGTVVDEAGQPRPGLPVGLALRTADAGRWLPEGAEPERLHYTDELDSVTDGRGRFHFADLAAGLYTITVSERGRDRSARPSLEVQLAAGEVRDDLVLAAPQGLAIRGTVVDPGGRPCERIVVRATPEQAGGPEARDNTRADGTFTLTGLTAGRYRLEAQTLFFNHTDEHGRELYDVSVEAVEAGTEDLHIALRPVAAVSGVVLTADGEPARDVAVTALDPHTGKRLTSKRVDDQGRFRLALPEGTTVDLEVLRIQPVTDDTWIIPEPPPDAPPPPRLSGVAAGTADVVLRLAE